MAHRRSARFAPNDTAGMSVSSRNWFEGSQVSKARPGAPFDFTHRYCRGHKLCHFSPDSPRRVGCSGKWLLDRKRSAVSLGHDGRMTGPGFPARCQAR